MHVLLTNDDGPPSAETSPYIGYLVEAIREYTDWDLSIVVPSSQKSWIGKAHLIGHDVTPSYIYTQPGNHQEYIVDGPVTQPRKGQGKSGNKNQDIEWTLLDATPATCANIGIHHLYEHRGPIDLVISGPNYGRNSTALYIMSSGTVGASMEAALCGVKSISISYAFETRIHNPAHITQAAKLSVKLVDYLYKNWNKETDLYSVNIPLCDQLNDNTKILYTQLLNNRWTSVFEPQRDEQGLATQFNWKPDFAHVDKTVRDSVKHHPGNDGWVVSQGMISVTPLKAAFQTVDMTNNSITLESESRGERQNNNNGTVVISTADKYVRDMWAKALDSVCTSGRYQLNVVYGPRSEVEQKSSPIVEYTDYDDLDFDRLAAGDESYFGCSYIYRKGLIRKHYLNNTVRMFCAKNPSSILNRAVPESFNLEVDYAEFLDDALDEAYELRQEIEAGGKTWILKPSMSDRAQGIRMFTTIDGLQEIFDRFEEEAGNDSEEEEEEGEQQNTSGGEDNHGVITSQLRHFIVQQYIENPLILQNGRKFHIRTYVLCVGAIKTYVCREMLALFALSKYKVPVSDDDGMIELQGHLTNTCLQGESQDDMSVRRFWDLELKSDEAELIFKQICEITGDLFNAATSVDRINFQALPNAFEMYGLDFLVTSDFQVHMLEVNAYPDFKQTGDKLNSIVSGFFAGVANRAIAPFLGLPSNNDDGLVCVLEKDMGGGM